MVIAFFLVTTISSWQMNSSCWRDWTSERHVWKKLYRQKTLICIRITASYNHDVRNWKKTLDSGLPQHFRAHGVLWPVRIHQQLGQIVLVLCFPLFLNPFWHVVCNLSLVMLHHSTQPGFRCFSEFLLGWGQMLCCGQDRWEHFLFYLEVSLSHPNYLQVEVMYKR